MGGGGHGGLNSKFQTPNYKQITRTEIQMTETGKDKDSGARIRESVTDIAGVSVAGVSVNRILNPDSSPSHLSRATGFTWTENSCPKRCSQMHCFGHFVI